MVPPTRPREIPSTSFPIHHTLIVINPIIHCTWKRR